MPTFAVRKRPSFSMRNANGLITGVPDQWKPGSENAVPIVLSMGMGVESTAILVRWIRDPDSRVVVITNPISRQTREHRFSLSDIVVVTAMTGMEKSTTGELFLKHVLPLMSANSIRYVQVARQGHSIRDGIRILDDSRSPRHVYIEGVHSLEAEYLAMGSVPQGSHNNRKCSIKFKGEVLEPVIEHIVGNHDYVHVLGFSSDEQRRVGRDRSYEKSGRISSYPLLDWEWTRDAAQQYLRTAIGDVETPNKLWPKSACVCCPFAWKADHESSDEVRSYYEAHPRDAARSLWMEYVSQCLNDRQPLLITRSLRSSLEEEYGRFVRVFDEFDRLKRSAQFGIFEIRRFRRQTNGRALPFRSLVRIRGNDGQPLRGTFYEMVEMLVHLQPRVEKTFFNFPSASLDDMCEPGATDTRVVQTPHSCEIQLLRRDGAIVFRSDQVPGQLQFGNITNDLVSTEPSGTTYSGIEWKVCVAPAVAQEKERSQFAQQWQELIGLDLSIAQQLTSVSGCDSPGWNM